MPKLPFQASNSLSLSLGIMKPDNTNIYTYSTNCAAASTQDTFHVTMTNENIHMI